MVSLAPTSLRRTSYAVGTLPGMMCRGAEQVNARLDQIRASGRTFDPEVLAERDGVVLIDPHVDVPPQLNPELHQILILRDDVVEEIRDYPTRAAAQAAFEATW